MLVDWHFNPVCSARRVSSGLCKRAVLALVRRAGHRFTFDRGETIYTENSRKYDVSRFMEFVNDDD
jgi:hypothetical protein